MGGTECRILCINLSRPIRIAIDLHAISKNLTKQLEPLEALSLEARQLKEMATLASEEGEEEVRGLLL